MRRSMSLENGSIQHRLCGQGSNFHQERVLPILGSGKAESMAVTITLANDTPDERQVRDSLCSLLQTYDLHKWQCTDRIRIEQHAISHSHPVLTIRAPMPDEDLLLDTYLHEQMHWFTMLPEHRAAIRCLEHTWRERYPEVPVEFPEGCGTERSNYLHFTVCALTHALIRAMVGDSHAERVLERQIEWPFYRFVYRTVRDDFPWMTTVIDACGLVW